MECFFSFYGDSSCHDGMQGVAKEDIDPNHMLTPQAMNETKKIKGLPPQPSVGASLPPATISFAALPPSKASLCYILMPIQSS